MNIESVVDFQTLLDYAEFTTGVRGIANIGVCRNTNGDVYAFLGHEEVSTSLPNYSGKIHKDLLVSEKPKRFRIKHDGKFKYCWLRKISEKLEMIETDTDVYQPPTEEDFMWNGVSVQPSDFINFGAK